MQRLSLAVALIAAAGAGAIGGHFSARLARVHPAAATASDLAMAADASSILYYRDPSGAPAWSEKSKNDAQGRAFLPVYDHEEISFDAPKKAPAATDRTILYYRNPMGLPDTSPVPKKDSMGMDYIPVYAGEDDGGSTLTISAGRLQRAGVRSEPAAPRALSMPVRAPGSVQIDERRVTVVSLRAQSFVEAVEAVTTGDTVRKGQPLMRLYSPEIAAAAAQYLSVLNQPAASGPGMLESSRRRLDNLEVPAEVVAEIERTRKVPITITWPAPRDAVVLERSISDGMRAMPGDALFRLADLSVVWALVDVAERDLAQIAPGQAVSLRARGYPGRSFEGRVALIYPQINRDTRTARVRVALANPDGVLRPDMYVEAEIATGTQEPVLSVPASAVIDSGSRRVVFVDKGEGRFEPRDVALGRHGDGYVEIREGLAEGDAVVVAATFLIDAESNLKSALRALAAGGNTP